jgi:hypothetical protein
MEKKLVGLAFSIAALAMGASAQTVTGSGTTNTVPVFTGASTVGNSPISVSGSNVGIGTNAPTVPLVVVTPNSFSVAASFQYTSDGQSVAQPFILNKPPVLQIVGGEDGNSYGLLGIIQPQVQNGGIGTLNFAATRASVAQLNSGTYVALQANDILGVIGFGGDAGVSIRNSSAIIQARATAAWSSTSSPGYLQFFTVPTGSITANERMRITDAGNVGINTTAPGAPLEVNGNVKLTANSGASVTFQDGTQQTTAWTGVLCGGDYAEAVKAAGEKKSYEPGDVLVLTDDSKGDVRKSAEPYSMMVAGIYATKPGVIGRRQSLKNEAEEVPMAMVGIVPTKVTAENGPIHRGDLLVSSSQPGYAMKGTDRSRLVGAVIGKAMGSLDSGQGVIEVLVTLQ